MIRKSLSFQGLKFLLTAQEHAHMHRHPEDTLIFFLIIMMNNVFWLMINSF